MRRVLCVLGVLLAAVPGPLICQSDPPPSSSTPEFKPFFDLRLRWEAFETPSSNALLDGDYNFPLARLRVGGDLKWSKVTLHGMLQGAASTNLPDNAAFGVGQTYVTANDGDTDPSQAGIAELSVALRPGTFQVVLGRQPWNDGLETLTGVAYLDGIKRRRIGDRLVGTWDWPNVGRRFDGVSFNGTLVQTAQLTGFALRPLAGGVNYKDAFEELDDLTVYGLSVTGRHGAWIPGSELRLFGIYYDDERPGAVQTAGGGLGFTTLGGHLLVGNERNDLLLWAALQDGDWGRQDQQAWACIVEAGHEFGATTKLAVRGGFAHASGDDPSTSEHEGFFNLLPTNHKFYGSMDYFAFSNLQNLYAELLLSQGPKWSLRLGADLFALSDRGDAWYVGSGPFDEERLGYTARRPVSGGFRDHDLGTEIDLEATFTLRKNLRLAAGGGVFAGAAAARQAFPVEEDGTWFYAQLTWAR